MTVQEISDLLKLDPLPEEGGLFRSSHRSSDILPGAALPRRYDGPHHLSSAIYYMLIPESCSRMRRLPTDEIFHFYLGAPVNLLLQYPEHEALIEKLTEKI
jgi:uncharacterized protein